MAEKLIILTERGGCCRSCPRATFILLQAATCDWRERDRANRACARSTLPRRVSEAHHATLSGAIYHRRRWHAIGAHALSFDLYLSMKAFGGSLGRNCQLLHSHLFSPTGYSPGGLSPAEGRTAKAERLAAIAEAHYQAAPDADEPPEAAAMAMPVPRPPVITNAVSTTRMTKPTGGRTAGLMPPAAP